MKGRIVVVGVLCAVVGMNAPLAHATTSTEALARMDAIIKEMQALRAEFAALVGATTQSTVTTGQVLGVSTTAVLTEEVVYGATNSSIMKVQRLLATDSEIYPEGTVSGYFGEKTIEAVRRFQIRFGLDPVGVVGPSTKAILEAFLAAYPTENYPAGLLKGAVPTAQTTVSSVVTTTPTVAATVTAPVTTTKIASITLDNDDGEILVSSRNSDGTRNKDILIYPEDEDELVEMIADELNLTEAQVRALVDLDEADLNSSGDEAEAQDAIDEAYSKIKKAKSAIADAEDDGDDTEDAQDIYDEARDAYNDAKDAFDDEEYNDAIDYAEEAYDLAKEAIDEL